jgi:glutamate-ammonia-ligase adenylyltransferase
MLPHTPTLQSQADSFILRCQEHPQALPDIDEKALAVVATSDFISENLLAFPAWWHEIVQYPPQATEWQHYGDWLSEALAAVSDEAGLMKALRLFRKRILTRIAW